MYLPEHSHCKHCGETTYEGEDYCNEECRANYESEQKAEKMKDYKFYGVIAASLIVIAIVGVIGWFLTK